MTFTELHTLAMDPPAFDAHVAVAYNMRAKLLASHHANLDAMHRLAGDKQRYQGRVRVWGMSTDQATDEVIAMSCEGDAKARKLLDERAALSSEIDRWADEITTLDTVYRTYNWTRYILCLSANGHVHRFTGCSTLYIDTPVEWRPDLSGLTTEQAVAKLGPTLCSVCYADAPVEQRSMTLTQVERQRTQGARDAAKAERQAKLDAKQLTKDESAEIAKVQGYWTRTDRITTVAGCLKVIRDSVETEVELEYWTQAGQGTRSVPGWSQEQLDRRVGNLTENLAELRTVADIAAMVLQLRERNHVGHGATTEAIAKVRASKRKSARKEWGL